MNDLQQTDYKPDEIAMAMGNYRPGNENTAKLYGFSITDYLDFSSDREISPGTAESLEAYKKYLINSGRPARSINTILSGIKQGILYAASFLGMDHDKYTVLKYYLDLVKGVRLSDLSGGTGFFHRKKLLGG